MTWHPPKTVPVPVQKCGYLSGEIQYYGASGPVHRFTCPAQNTMSLIQFTRNHTDHSTDKGYQFEFFCDRCGNGYKSAFEASAVGMATSALRTVGNLFGGVFGSVGNSTYEIERAVQGPGHDSAFRKAVEEAKPHFKQCPKCAKWVCGATCWNQKRMLCYEC